MRTSQHVIDTKSIKAVLGLLPDHWVIRELTERDYGIDLMVEIFAPDGTNKYGSCYKSTGAIFHIQVKGTQSALRLKKATNYSYQIEKKSLLYVESFSSPFLLFRVDISKKPAKAYFVWLQRYIKDVLNFENHLWRESKQKTFAIRIPKTNDIETRVDKIERIASRPNFIQELVEFREAYSTLNKQLSAASSGNLEIDQSTIDFLRAKARQMLYLPALFKYNDCCIDKSCVDEVVLFTTNLTTTSKQTDFANHPHEFNLSLLSGSIDGMSNIEEFVAENDQDTVY